MAINLTGNPYTGQLASLGGLQTGLGTAVSGVGLGQLLAGASGQLTPADQALVKSTLDQMNLGTSSRYANLGLGGSTMESQDLGSNQLRSEAESAELAALEERLGLQALQGGESFLGGAGTNITNASRDYQAAYQSLINTIAGLGNKSAGGGLGSDLSGVLRRLFGGGGSSPSDVANFWSTAEGAGSAGTTGVTQLNDFWNTAAGVGGDAGSTAQEVSDFWANA